MNQNLSEQIQSLLNKNKKRRKQLVTLFAAMIVVIGATAIGLSLPATTATPEQICGYEEHTHSDSCYETVTSLVCGQEESEEHTHTEDCYSSTQNLICQLPEHVHDANCYEQGGTISAQAADQMTAEVTYAAGVIHQNTVFTATLVDTANDAYVQKALTEIEADLNNSNQRISVYRAYDLSLYRDNVEVQPDGTVTVNLTLVQPLTSENANGTWKLYHIDDQGNLKNLTDDYTTGINANDGKTVTQVSFETSSFSSFLIVGAENIPEEPAVVESEEETVTESASEESKTEEKAEKKETSEESSKDEDEKDAEEKKDKTEESASKDEKKEESDETEGAVITYLAQDFEAEANGISVSVHAEEGALPEGTEIKVSKVSDENVLVQALAASGTADAKVKAVDISFINADGEEIEPLKAVRVTMKADEVAETNEITVVHVDDQNQASIVEQTANQELSEEEKPAADEVVFDSSEFSTYAIVYTVDFSYGEYTFSMDGESSLLLSQLLEALHIYDEDQELLTVADIADVTFSDESLVSVSQEDGDWMLTSLQPFTSEEQLTITLKNGDQIVVDVTDEQTTGMTINSVTLTVNNNTYDLSKTDNIKIKNTDSIEFTLDFSVVGGTLNADNNTIEYQLPDGIKVTQAVTNKNIMNGNTIVGTYSIDTDGKVTFVFNDSYVEKNANGSKIDADLTFTASVDSSGTEDGGTVPIAFTDEIKVDLEVEKAETGDLTVNKSVSSNNYSDGYITYTVTVSSTEGTAGEITLKDVITTSGLDITSLSNFTISPELSGFSPNSSTEGFEVTLPKLDAGSTYTITYRVNYDKPDVPLTGTSVNNKITGTSTASKGTELTSSAEINTNVKPGDIIGKWGSYNSETDSVTWYVTINKQRANLNGWTLQDTFNGTEFTGTVTVDPAIEGQTVITLPYTWEKDDYNTYTITYTTSADALLGNYGAVNNATLTKDGSSISTGDVTGGSGVQYDPLEKDATNITVNDDNTLATVDWTVTINASRGTIAANWTYKDELWNGQWFTGAQLKAIKSAIDQALKDAGVSLNYTMKANLQDGTDGLGAEVSYDQIVDAGKYKVYTLYFTSDLDKGSSFTYSYQSTAPIDGLTSDTTFRNNAYVEDKNGTKMYDDGQIVYKPPKEPEIIKTDGSSTEDTSHDIASLDGIFNWDLKVTIPQDYSGTTLTVTEHLPAGVSLDDLEILAQGQTETIFGATHFVSPDLGENKLTINGTGGPFEIVLTITEREDGGLDAVIVIPENLVKHSDIQEVRFVVQVHPTATSKDISEEDSGWTKDGDGYWYRKFDNTVELIDKDNKTISTDSQNQTITLKDGKQLVDKSAGTPDDNVIPYSLNINLDGDDLVEGSDTITLTDVLQYEYNIWDLVNVNYIEDSLVVYESNANGEKVRKLDSSEYSFTYGERIDSTESGKGNAVRTLKVVLPDSTPLIVEYKYLVSQPNDGYGKWRTISNRAYLDGYSDNRYSDSTSNSVQVQKSSAHATIEGITLKKVDANNYQIALEGVTFTLYKYDTETGSYISTGKTYTTDDTGNINFTKDDISYETAYKLVEESTNEGYFKETSPFYFIVTEVTLSDGQSTNYTAPDDFNGTVYSVGSTFYFANRKIPEKGLSVSKVWKDYEGNVITDTSDMPEIILRLKKGDEVVKTFTLNEDNGWTVLFDDLDADGQYTVEEATELVGYKTPDIAYTEGDSKEVKYVNGNTYGEATVTNQPSESTPTDGSTMIAVSKKWVSSDGTSELTGNDIADLEAEVQLVRYKAKQVGTVIHFYLCTDSNSTYEQLYSDIMVAESGTVNFTIPTTGWNGALWDFGFAPSNGDSFWSTANKVKKYASTNWDSSSPTGKSASFSIDVTGRSEVYLVARTEECNFDRTASINIAEDSKVSADEYYLDLSYSGTTITLNQSNSWSAVLAGLPNTGTEDGVKYFYSYAVKEISCSTGFAYVSYSTGENGVDGSNIPISGSGNKVIITNKQKEEYELPATGGSGTLKYILSGLSLMIIAILLLLRRKTEGRRSI